VTVVALPRLAADDAGSHARNRRLIEENARLHELAATYAARTAVRPIVDLYGGIEARVIGFPPENESRAVTIDKGSTAGVRSDDGVLAVDGAVGRIVSVAPFSSTVVLVTDYTSRIPAIVQRGRWWGIARGNLASVVVEYIEQDAPVRVGDVVVTGEGRSFHSGVPIGTVTAIERGNATLYQTAILKTSVDLGALDRVVVVPK
jgi:rod shape-determining protein MreC